jgi:hypothetical protein
VTVCGKETIGVMVGSLKMPRRHLITVVMAAREWINEIPTVPIYDGFSSSKLPLLRRNILYATSEHTTKDLLVLLIYLYDHTS